MKDENFELRAEVERKTTECERLEIYMDELVKQKLNQAKAEAINEFAERLRELMLHKAIMRMPLLDMDIDNLVKEMTE